MHAFRFQAGVTGRGLTLTRRMLYGLRAITTFPILFFEIRAVLGISRTRRKSTVRFMNDLCNATLGTGLDLGNKVISSFRRGQTRAFDLEEKPRLELSSNLNEDQINAIVDEISRVGFVRLPQYLSTDIAEKLRKNIEAAPGRDSAGGNFENISEWREHSSSGRIDTDDKTLIEIIERENIDFSALTLISRKYLRASPILLGPHSWSTKPIRNLTDLQLEEQAMAYHCDSDFFGFLKVFLLLTDVKMENGPFTFISRSHRGKRHVQGRVSDQVLEIHPGEELYGIGQPGDIVLADTKGWHKAMPPKEGTRTMVQWLYTNGLLGSMTQ